MSQQTAVLIGATGLIGHHLLIRLLENPDYVAVKALVRRPMHMKHPKLTVIVAELSDKAMMKKNMEGGTVLFSCIGATTAQVLGNRDTYRSIDYDIPVNAAQLAKELDFNSVLIVSAIGANAKASNFYLKMKGEVNDAVIASGVPSVHIFKPSLLLGKRKELRVMELIAQKVMPVLSIFIPRRFSRVKPIEATKVADTMMQAGLTNEAGVFVYEYDQMK